MKYSEANSVLAAISSKTFGTFCAFGAIGSALGRTAMLGPVLLGRPEPAKRSLAIVALTGWIIGMAVLAGLVLAGVDSLPDWVAVPTAIASVQSFYSLAMGVILSDSPSSSYPGNLSPGDFAYMLYGVLLLPPAILFTVTMTVDSLLS